MTLKTLLTINRYKMCATTMFMTTTNVHSLKFFNYKKHLHLQKNLISTSAPYRYRIPDFNTSDSESDIEETNSCTNFMQEGYARDLLYKNVSDRLLHKIYSCASVEEIFLLLETDLNRFNSKHITQTIFVLYDLSQIYKELAGMKNSNTVKIEFFTKLLENKNFQNLLNLIERKVDSFNVLTLSYCVLYLNKLGMDVLCEEMQLFCTTVRRKLLEKFCISSSSRFLQTVFNDSSLRPFYMSQDVIPLVIDQINHCSTVDTLNYLSISLNKLHRIITNETLSKYKLLVDSFIQDGTLQNTSYKSILNVIAFLNYPQWRDENSILISKCIMLLKNVIHQLNSTELLLLYEVFYKIREPGEILNDLQRCSYKYFYRLDDSPTEEKLRLFSSIIFFASPQLKKEFKKKLKIFIENCHNYERLLILRKVMSHLKISDKQLCDDYWNKILDLIPNENELDVFKLCYHYINFSTDIDNYRHLRFEKEILELLEKLSTNYYYLFPQKILSILNFAILYSANKTFLEFLVGKMESNWEKLTPIDCLKTSNSLKIFEEINKNISTVGYARRIDKTLDKYLNQQLQGTDENVWKNKVLLQSCVYKNKMDTVLMSKFLSGIDDDLILSSKYLESIYYCLLMTNSLVPEKVDHIVDYIIKYKDHILGFNVMRVMYLAYFLGYKPKNLDEFCKAGVDILIRDQERMGGLIILYSAIALCFFNKLPEYLIKSIFNVEFMEKLDLELEQCYARDKYPRRVRNYLMQLNRAVCLDYPECNIPWFHKKYIEETSKGSRKHPSMFSAKVKEYLSRIVDSKGALLENVITPYGYEIDFIVNLNKENKFTGDESQITKRLALILISEYAYTKIVTQLKGHYQLKRRHLEILGYKVIIIKFSDWIGLFYDDERIQFLKQLIVPQDEIQSNR